MLRTHCGLLGVSALVLALGVMDVVVMTSVAALITAERVSPAGERVARAIGLVLVACGTVLLALAMHSLAG